MRPAIDARLAELEAELPGQLVPVEPGIVLVITEGVYLLQPAAETEETDAPVEPDPSGDASNDEAHATVAFEVPDDSLRVIEVSCRDGYRARATVVEGRASLDGVPMDPAADCRASLKHATRLVRQSVIGGQNYRCSGAGVHLECLIVATEP